MDKWQDDDEFSKEIYVYILLYKLCENGAVEVCLKSKEIWHKSVSLYKINTSYKNIENSQSSLNVPPQFLIINSFNVSSHYNND